jgi:hypothetical protein
MKPCSSLISVLLLAMSGCASVKIPAPSTVIENVTALRDSGIASTNVGAFALAKGKPAKLDKSQSARGSTIGTESGSFSAYLREALVSDLQAAGKYNASATTTVTGELVDCQLHAAGAREANALLSVHFMVSRDGKPVFDKVVNQAETWKSSFVGAVAIPDAFNHFGEQFRLVLLKLYKDADFVTSLKPPN